MDLKIVSVLCLQKLFCHYHPKRGVILIQVGCVSVSKINQITACYQSSTPIHASWER